MSRLWVVLVSIALPLVIVSLACGAPTIEGVVMHKDISGWNEGMISRTVLTIHLSDDGRPVIDVQDEDLVSFFADGEVPVIIGDSLALEIESRYDIVKYKASIRSETNGPYHQQNTFLASREVFNQLRVGQTVKFEVKNGPVYPSRGKIGKLLAGP